MRLLLSLAAGAAVAGIAVGLAGAFNPDTLVSVGPPTSPFTQNKQNDERLVRRQAGLRPRAGEPSVVGDVLR
jgi:hypothetical protein